MTVQRVEEPRRVTPKIVLRLLTDHILIRMDNTRRRVLRPRPRVATRRPADRELAFVNLVNTERASDLVVLLDNAVTDDVLDNELDRTLRGVPDRIPGLLDSLLQGLERVANAVRRLLEQRLDLVAEPVSDRRDDLVLDKVPSVLDRVAHRVEARLELVDDALDHGP